MRLILFNIYPYREKKVIEKRNKNLIQLGAGSLTILFLLYCINSTLNEKLEKQHLFMRHVAQKEAEISERVARVQTMKNEVNRLQRQVDALEGIEKDAVTVSELGSFLDSTIPSGIGLMMMKLDKGVLFIQGLTNSVPNLANWVEIIEQKPVLFKEVDLVYLRERVIQNTSIKSDGDNLSIRNHEFELRLVLSARQLNETPKLELVDGTTR